MLASMLQLQEGKPHTAVEVGLYETGLHVASRDLVGVQLKTQLLGKPEREPHGEFSMPGYGAYQTADERWIYLLMLNDTHWLKFCQAMDIPHDESLATLRRRKKARAKVEELVKGSVAARSFDGASACLQAAGVGFTEVLPLERVLDAPQARQPGKLRRVRFRGFEFAVPEFPRMHTGDDSVQASPPPDLGAHTAPTLKSAGIDAAEYAALLRSGAVAESVPDAFAWAAVRRGEADGSKTHASSITLPEIPS
jgi:crotonobetainyl-CoA:carnitine CoA-transferase CaiB-like acyl-CoA transferase